MTDTAAIKKLFDQYAPDVDCEIVEPKGFIDSVPGIVILAANTAFLAFPFLWKIFIVWMERYANGKVTIKYKNLENKEVVVEFSKLTKDEVEEKVREASEKAQPKLVKIEFSNGGKYT